MLTDLNKTIYESIGGVEAFSGALREAVRRAYASSDAFRALEERNKSFADTVSKITNAVMKGEAVNKNLIKSYTDWSRANKDLEKSTKLVAAVFEELDKKAEGAFGAFKRAGAASLAFFSQAKNQIATITGLTLGMDHLVHSLSAYNKAMFDSGRVATRYGESASSLTSQFKRISDTTTFSKRGFAELNKAFKDMYTGIPPSTKAVADFAEAMMGKLGYAEDEIISKTKDLLSLQSRMPNILGRINSVMKDYSVNADKGAASLARLRLTLRSIGASASEIENVMNMAQPPKPAILAYAQFEKQMAKFNQRTKDAELIISQKLASAMEKLVDLTGKLAMGFANVDAAILKMGAGVMMIAGPLTGIISKIAASSLMTKGLLNFGSVAAAGGTTAAAAVPAAAVPAAAGLGAAGLGAISKARAGLTGASTLLRGGTLSRVDSAGIERTVSGSKAFKGGAKGGIFTGAIMGGLAGYSEYAEREGQQSRGSRIAAGIGRGAVTTAGAIGGGAAGAWVGGAIGALVTAGNPIGAAIGAQIGRVAGPLLGGWLADKFAGKAAANLLGGKVHEKTAEEKNAERWQKQIYESGTREIGGVLANAGSQGAKDVLDQQAAGDIDSEQARSKLLLLAEKEFSTKKDTQAIDALILKNLVTTDELTKIYGGDLQKAKRHVEEIYSKGYRPIHDIQQAMIKDLDEMVGLYELSNAAIEKMKAASSAMQSMQGQGFYTQGSSAIYEQASAGAEKQMSNIRSMMDKELNQWAMSYPEQMDKIFGTMFSTDRAEIWGQDVEKEYVELLKKMSSTKADIDFGKLSPAMKEEAEKAFKVMQDELNKFTSEENLEKMRSYFKGIEIDFSSESNIEKMLDGVREKLEGINRLKADGVDLDKDSLAEEQSLEQLLSRVSEYRAKGLAAEEAFIKSQKDAAEGPFKATLAQNEKSIDLAKMRLNLADQNNLGIVKSYQYTKEVNDMLTKQIGTVEDQNKSYDAQITGLGKNLGIHLNIQDALDDRMGFEAAIRQSLSEQNVRAGIGSDLTKDQVTKLHTINALVDGRAEGEKRILGLATEQAQLTRQIRESYLDAMEEYASKTAGSFSALIGSTEMGVTQLMGAGAPGTFKYGASGDGKQARTAPPKWSKDYVGAMTGEIGETGLTKFGNVEQVLDPTDRRDRSKFINRAKSTPTDMAMMLGGKSEANDWALKAPLQAIADNSDGTNSRLITTNQLLAQIRDGTRPIIPVRKEYTGQFTGGSLYKNGIAVAGARGVEDAPVGTSTTWGRNGEMGSEVDNIPTGTPYAAGGYIVRKSAVDANQGLIKAMGGGIFKGGTPGKDSIPLRYAKGGYALVQPGEALITNPQHMGLAEKVNKGIKRFASGGKTDELTGGQKMRKFLKSGNKKALAWKKEQEAYLKKPSFYLDFIKNAGSIVGGVAKPVGRGTIETAGETATFLYEFATGKKVPKWMTPSRRLRDEETKSQKAAEEMEAETQKKKGKAEELKNADMYAVRRRNEISRKEYEKYHPKEDESNKALTREALEKMIWGKGEEPQGPNMPLLMAGKSADQLEMEQSPKSLVSKEQENYIREVNSSGRIANIKERQDSVRNKVADIKNRIELIKSKRSGTPVQPVAAASSPNVSWIQAPRAKTSEELGMGYNAPSDLGTSRGVIPSAYNSRGGMGGGRMPLASEVSNNFQNHAANYTEAGSRTVDAETLSSWQQDARMNEGLRAEAWSKDPRMTGMVGMAQGGLLGSIQGFSSGGSIGRLPTMELPSSSAGSSSSGGNSSQEQHTFQLDKGVNDLLVMKTRKVSSANVY